MKPNNPHPLLARLLPFFVMGVAIVLFVVSIFIFSYIFLFALIVGFVLFAIGYVRAKFFKPKNGTFQEPLFVIKTTFTNTGKTEQKTTKPVEHTGRIIEHDEDSHQN